MSEVRLSPNLVQGSLVSIIDEMDEKVFFVYVFR